MKKLLIIALASLSMSAVAADCSQQLIHLQKVGLYQDRLTDRVIERLDTAAEYIGSIGGDLRATAESGYRVGSNVSGRIIGVADMLNGDASDYKSELNKVTEARTDALNSLARCMAK